MNIMSIEEMKTSCNDPFIVANSSGIITFVNDSFTETFKWQKEKLLGQMLVTIMPEKFRDAHNLGFSRFTTTEKATVIEHELELEVVCGDGSHLQSIHYIMAEKKDRNWIFAGIIKPVSN